MSYQPNKMIEALGVGLACLPPYLDDGYCSGRHLCFRQMGYDIPARHIRPLSPSHTLPLC